MSEEDRKRFEGEPLAKGLHAFYASHKSAYPMLPGTLKRLMGRESMQQSKWQQALINALSKVEEATGWGRFGIATGGDFEGKVVVMKNLRHRKGVTKPAGEVA